MKDLINKHEVGNYVCVEFNSQVRLKQRGLSDESCGLANVKVGVSFQQSLKVISRSDEPSKGSPESRTRLQARTGSIEIK